MTVITDQIANANKANVEMLLGFAKIQFAAFERLSAINFNATKAAFEAGIGQTRALGGDKDVQVGVNSVAIRPNMDNVISYSRSVYELAMQTQGEFAELCQSRATEFNNNMIEFLEEVSKSAPYNPDIAIASVKSALAAGNSAYESITKAAKQATEMSEANFTAATHHPKEAKRKAA